MRVFQNANYPFMQWRRRAYIITALLFAMALGAMGVNYSQIGSWMNYGADFTGGTLVQVDLKQPAEAAQVRQALGTIGGTGWEVTAFGSTRQYLIRIPAREYSGELGTSPRDRVLSGLQSAYPQAEVMRTEAVSPKVGDELQYKALWAILLSMAATMMYLWYRFEWRFGLAAIAATLHDILITLGILAVLRSEISLATVAAFLTIVGYSLNDTIVVFDRIRENLAKPRHGMSYFDLLNKSINETLPRTVLTGGSTIGCLLALLVFGGPVIFDFSLVLLLGIVIGTFSSIFVATPVLYFIETKWPHKAPPKETAVRSTSRNRAAAGA